MATQADVRRIALSFPGTIEKDGRFAFEVRHGPKYKGFCWVWLERIAPKKPRVANPRVLAVRVADLDAKEILLMADAGKFFTEPHYDGFPAVLVRLEKIGKTELRELLQQAWLAQASKPLIAKFVDAKVNDRTISPEAPVSRATRESALPQPMRTTRGIRRSFRR